MQVALDRRLPEPTHIRVLEGDLGWSDPNLYEFSKFTVDGQPGRRILRAGELLVVRIPLAGGGTLQAVAKYDGPGHSQFSQVMGNNGYAKDGNLAHTGCTECVKVSDEVFQVCQSGQVESEALVSKKGNVICLPSTMADRKTSCRIKKG